jgi:hypothetical protein
MTNSRDNQRNELRKKRNEYTKRTSSRGQKFSKGGRAEADNQGRSTDDNLQVSRDRRTGSSEKIY